MNREEFESLTKRKVTPEEYGMIEYVYTWHPSITDTKGKQQIAQLFLNGGMRVISDMCDTANKARGIYEHMQDLNHRINALRDEIAIDERALQSLRG